MRKFHYLGKNHQGTEQAGIIEALSETDAAKRLLTHGVFPYQIKCKSQALFFEEIKRCLFPRWGIRTIDLVLMFSQLYRLTKAQVTFVEALRAIVQTNSNQRLTEVLKKVISHIESGLSLAQSFYPFESYFGEYVVTLIALGEKTGQLEFAFKQIANHLKSEVNLNRQIQQTLRYPLVVLIALFSAILIVNVYVMPSFIKFYASYSAQLPPVTQGLIGMSDFIVQNQIGLLVGTLGIGLGVFVYLRSETGRYVWGKYKLKLPLLGHVLHRLLIIRLCHQLAYALSCHVPLLAALKVVARMSGNKFISEKIENVKQQVEAGGALSEAFNRANILSPLLIQMIKLAEKTDTLPEVLNEMAGVYQDEVSYELKTLSDRLEPILLLVFGFFVLLLAVGVFLPMWDISSVALQGLHR